MPSMLAHIIYAMKKHNNWNTELYLGAQGPDVFFYANEKKYKEIGDILHKISSNEFKEIMKGFPNDFYKGFILHMELDEKLHGIINSYYSEPISHTHFEYNFDELLSLKIYGMHFIEQKWWKILQIENIEIIDRKFNDVLKKEFGITGISYGYAYKKMLKNLKLLFQYPIFKKNLLMSVIKLIGLDYSYLYPDIKDKDIEKLKHLEREFFDLFEGE
ncbi:hypothetical protein LN42_02905 [Marinitoga sp. 1137]|uniref:hypothetical protein n=1 Tax=Marinitoga sp. 1137 TaxID=1545835 RepID=UPI000950A9D5|nr:hypothetical protein [Marinitoga sp. 1137]APT75455.1 hypothetical protein LN42_02905 [Marinitoga sp. 1137]